MIMGCYCQHHVLTKGKNLLFLPVRIVQTGYCSNFPSCSGHSKTQINHQGWLSVGTITIFNPPIWKLQTHFFSTDSLKDSQAFRPIMQKIWKNTNQASAKHEWLTRTWWVLETGSRQENRLTDVDSTRTWRPQSLKLIGQAQVRHVRVGWSEKINRSLTGGKPSCAAY